MSHKSILVFCDGTGMDGSLTEPKDWPGNGGAQQQPTNVVRLSRSINATRTGDFGKIIPQIVFYQSGTGSIANFDGQGIVEDKSLQLYGIAVASKIRDAYVFIAQNYSPGDDICLFGFSRGAYTARKVAGLINRIGLLDRKDLSKFFYYWLQLYKHEEPGPPYPQTSIPIKCVAVWDTVGSVFSRAFNPIIDALSIKDTSLAPNIEFALHALAMQENRKPFMCTLWTVPSGGLAPGQTLKQRWFAGAHSDVGGGYVNHELSDVAVFWIASEISSFVSLDLDYLTGCRQPIPVAPWGNHQPHNAWKEFGSIPFTSQDRLEGGQIFKQSEFHLSVGHAPTTLNDPKNMITLNDIKKKFGTGWGPDYKDLNDFEKKQKDDWPTHLPSTPENDGKSTLDTPEGFIKGTLGLSTSSEYKGDVPLGTYWIRNVYSQKSLSLKDAKPGSQIINFQFGGKDNQKWILEPGVNGYKLRNAATTASFLSFPDGVFNPSQGTSVYGCDALEWKVEKAADKQYRIVLTHNLNLVLDLSDLNTDDGAKIVVWSNTGGDNQRWTFSPV